jgi:proteasome lid subunit RPN8/RPN11
MMSDSRIRILPPEKLVPKIAPLPVDHARRWYSPFEVSGGHPALSVFVTQSAYVRVCVHAASEPEYEVGGILVGQWYADADSDAQFIVVERALPARYTRQGSVYLTFTQESLVDLHAKIEEHFPSKRIVGWYHTHPHMGVFLSYYDTWLHHHFFPEVWQVALVVDPHSATGGFFIRQADDELDPSQYSGFYELNGHVGRSVVHWRNLQPIANASEEEMDANE